MVGRVFGHGSQSTRISSTIPPQVGTAQRVTGMKKIAIPYTTIAQSVTVEGLAGFEACRAAVTLRPGGLGLGIIFRRQGVAVRLRPAILARSPIRHTTSISTPAGYIHTVEHLLGVVQALCITDLLIDVEEPGHVPFLDGSGEPFLHAICDAGVVSTTSELSTGLAMDGQVMVQSEEGEARAEEGTSLHVQNRISFPLPIGEQRITYTNSGEMFREIARARSFLGQGWNKQQFRNFYAFYRHGDGPDDTNLITHDGRVYDVTLRMDDECVRHKTLDVLGDLMILGAPVLGRFTFDRPGHALVQTLVLKLAGLTASSAVEEEPVRGGVEQLARFPNAPWMHASPNVRGSPSDRSPETYLQIVDQFRVDVRERYRPREGKTYCNIFVWDVTSALGAEIPHWLSPSGTPVGPDTPLARRLTINEMYDWLITHGAEYGWEKVSFSEAVDRVQLGFPAVAFRRHLGGNGHAAILLPLRATDLQPLVAQAGSRCFSRGRLSDAFADRVPEFWFHN